MSNKKPTLIERLKEWEKMYNEIKRVHDSLHFVGFMIPESPLYQAIYGSFDRYTDILSEVIGDNHEWLNWYCWENDMGKKELEICPAEDAEWRPIKTIEDLAMIIEETQS